jgi:hypothetical protein
MTLIAAAAKRNSVSDTVSGSDEPQNAFFDYQQVALLEVHGQH